ncbi:hypothetical protein B296_00002650 [Ensete ventricosum]|uniref:TF-B3 domain-containing protein n=1 Tax=Ensete ventricosum TaxID=4639 RepID=A0A427AWP2_ENSVE|nr:hypothetical protein B296_00002650 [Ensete ventricosum]
MARKRSRTLDRGGGSGVFFSNLVASGGPMVTSARSDSSVVLAACSLTSEESNNHPGIYILQIGHAAGHHVSNCSTNGENNPEDDVSSPNPSEPNISDAEGKTIPLSGKPFFSIIMSKTQVQRPYQLVISFDINPGYAVVLNFIAAKGQTLNNFKDIYYTCHPETIISSIPKIFWPHLPNTCVALTLHFKKKIWEMRYNGDQAQRRFDSGWKHFANDNNLKIGDCCFFELMDDKNFTFRVQLLRGDLPAECRNNGLSSDRPILID